MTHSGIDKSSLDQAMTKRRAGNFLGYLSLFGSLAVVIAITLNTLPGLPKVVRIGTAVVWVLTPVILIIVSIRECMKTDDEQPHGKVMPAAIGLVLLADWACFSLLFAAGFIGGFGSHYVTTRLANWFMVGSLLLFVAAIATKVARVKLTLASLLVFALWVGSELVA